jgi:hypothetical protein
MNLEICCLFSSAGVGRASPEGRVELQNTTRTWRLDIGSFGGSVGRSAKVDGGNEMRREKIHKKGLRGKGIKHMGAPLRENGTWDFGTHFEGFL